MSEKASPGHSGSPLVVKFRTVRPTDTNRCFDIEKASYPADEAATRSSLQYRQHHAEKYFRCAVVPDLDGDDDVDTVIGFICATRTWSFDHGSMSNHDSTGPLLAIHSVVVDEQYRHRGIAKAMLQDYVETCKSMDDGVEKLVLMAKSNLIGFYCLAGFVCLGPSEIEHGSERWFDLELDLRMEKGRLSGRSCWIVDSFTNAAGKGNPAAVVLLSSSPYENGGKTEWMQMIAAEFNLSETAFIWPRPMPTNGGAVESNGERQRQFSYGIRFFTPTVEVTLCGHATLASAAIVFQTLPVRVTNDLELAFHAKKDVLVCRPQTEHNKHWMNTSLSIAISMSFPRKEITALDDEQGQAVTTMLKSTFPHLADEVEPSVLHMGLDQDGCDVLVEVTTDLFTKIGYDGLAIANLLEWDGYTRGILVCSEGLEEESADFRSRCFFPKAGIDEDPVTGSAHCTLAPYFASKLNKSTLKAYQASRRGGYVNCAVEGDRVMLVGSAVVVMAGTLKQI